MATWESDRVEACMTAGLAVSIAPAYVKTKSVTEHEVSQDLRQMYCGLTVQVPEDCVWCKVVYQFLYGFLQLTGVWL